MPAAAVTPADLPPEATVVDVREPDEWAAGHVEGSLHLPLGQLTARAGELPPGRLVLVCRSGARSAQAADWLVDTQSRAAVNLDGGLQAWRDSGRPLVTDAGQPGTVA